MHTIPKVNFCPKIQIRQSWDHLGLLRLFEATEVFQGMYRICFWTKNIIMAQCAQLLHFLAKVLNGAQWAHELANKNEQSLKSIRRRRETLSDKTTSLSYVILHAIKVSE